MYIYIYIHMHIYIYTYANIIHVISELPQPLAYHSSCQAHEECGGAKAANGCLAAELAQLVCVFFPGGLSWSQCLYRPQETHEIRTCYNKPSTEPSNHQPNPKKNWIAPISLSKPSNHHPPFTVFCRGVTSTPKGPAQVIAKAAAATCLVRRWHLEALPRSPGSNDMPHVAPASRWIWNDLKQYRCLYILDTSMYF